jgi:tyrosine-protein kinase Etk/Wzc
MKPLFRLRKSKKADVPPPRTPPPAPPRLGPSRTYAFSPALVTLETLEGKQAEALRQTAANLVIHHLDLGRRGVAVCSTAAGAGCSFVTANLGVVLAQAGISTLLVDANLTHPSLETYFRPEERPAGLAQLLEGDDLELPDIVHADVLPHLSLVYSGGGGDRFRDLLRHERFEGFAADCMRGYQCVLFDTPPANRSTDARRVAAVVRYAMTVARRGLTFTDDVGQLVTELQQDGATMVGAVLNEG